METIDSIGFFFLCRIKEKGKDGESRGREKEGFLSPLISVDATVIVEKESNFYYREWTSIILLIV